MSTGKGMGGHESTASKTTTWLTPLAILRALIFARTETRGFVNEVWGKADALFFLHGRIHFHRPGGERAQANAGAPSVLVAYGPQDVAALAECSLAGTFIQLNRTRQAAA